MVLCPADMRSCKPKKKCLYGPNEGQAYNPQDPCCGFGLFDSETCDCDAQNAYSLILRLRAAGFESSPSSCIGRGSSAPSAYRCGSGGLSYTVESTEFQTYGGFTAPFTFKVMNDFELPYYFPSPSRTCAYQYDPGGPPLVDYPDFEGLGKAQRKYSLRDAEDKIVIREVSINVQGYRGDEICWGDGSDFLQTNEPLLEILHVNGPGLPVKKPGDFGGPAYDGYIGLRPF